MKIEFRIEAWVPWRKQWVHHRNMTFGYKVDAIGRANKLNRNMSHMTRHYFHDGRRFRIRGYRVAA